MRKLFIHRSKRCPARTGTGERCHRTRMHTFEHVHRGEYYDLIWSETRRAIAASKRSVTTGSS